MHQDVDTSAIREILTRHGVPKHHHGEFEYLVETGLFENETFRRNLHRVPHYMAACEEVMEFLSRPFYPLRPLHPPHFESLTESDFPPPRLEPLYEQS